ncbi:MAG: hypothetical protein ABS52_04260 [Gemmatimonadetes bacterium SCN 70-22]|nr:MAG: hypothetical protein ABS52_04260 [Gemmatimonadetes bacterium SCN 70-22]
MLLLSVAFGCSADPGFSGRTAEEWIRQLEQSPDSVERRAAARALGSVLAIHPRSTRVTAALVRALADTSDDVRLEAGTALVQHNRLAPTAVPGLVRLMSDSAHEHTREHAAELLAAVIPENVGDVVSPLIRALEDPSVRVRGAAVRALVRLGEWPQTVEGLRRAAASGGTAAKEGAREALARLARSQVPVHPGER